MSAPESRSNWAHFVWPAATAHRKGVNPLASLESTSAQFLSRILRHSGFPKDAALQRAEKIVIFRSYVWFLMINKGKFLRHSELIRSDEGLTLETSALESL